MLHDVRGACDGAGGHGSDVGCGEGESGAGGEGFWRRQQGGTRRVRLVRGTEGGMHRRERGQPRRRRRSAAPVASTFVPESYLKITFKHNSGQGQEKNPFNDKQSQIAERQTVGEQGPGDQQPGRGRRRAGGMRRGAGMQREEEREVNQK